MSRTEVREGKQTMRTLGYTILAVCAAIVLLAVPATRAELECHAVSAGAETVTPAMHMNVGQVAIGRASNGSVDMHAGVIPCLTAAGVPIAGDCDGDGDIDLDDFQEFTSCFLGPMLPAPGGCDCADVNSDGAVDLLDFALLQDPFASP